MYKKFSFITTLLLNIITCGIYGFYVMYVITEDHNKIAENTGDDKVMNFLLAYLLSLVTCGIYIYVWYYQYWKQSVALAQKKGIKATPSENAFVLLILTLIPYYCWYLICDSSNMLADAYQV